MKLLGDEEIQKIGAWLKIAILMHDAVARGLDREIETSEMLLLCRKVAKAQAKLTRQEDYEWLMSQPYGGQGRQRIFRIDCDELDDWKQGDCLAFGLDYHGC